MSTADFNRFSNQVAPAGLAQAIGNLIQFQNRSGAKFTVVYADLLQVLKLFLEKNEEISEFIRGHKNFVPGSTSWTYKEKIFRDLFEEFFGGPEFKAALTMAGSQTKPYMSVLSMLVGWKASNLTCLPPDDLLLDEQSLKLAFLSAKTLDASPAGNGSEEGVAVTAAFEEVCQFCADYEQSGAGWTTTDARVTAAVSALQTISNRLKQEFSSYRGIEIRVETTKGVGWFPRVPWICLLPPGQSVSDGVYVAICFGREGAGAVAGFAESVTNRKGLATVLRSASLPLKINVDGPGAETKYNDTFENPFELVSGAFDLASLRKHLVISLDRSLKHLDLKPQAVFDGSVISEFLAVLNDAGFIGGAEAAKSFVAALLAKPFAILTGNSGSGKTKLAELFAHWLSSAERHRFALVPVGADWTDNRNVLGFVNHLRSTIPSGESVEVPIYQSTPILDLLLAASTDPRKPYFLILDEMNLSHVERYFADFLSAMESHDGVLHLHREGLNLPRKLLGIADVPPELNLPDNLFVIGTVNVDETTYMFSPKVLDRANVLEFRVDQYAAEQFLAGGAGGLKTIIPASAGYAEAFLTLAYRARGCNGTGPLALADPATVDESDSAKLKRCGETISSLFKLMQSRHQEFAFRSIAEILRFLAVDYELTVDKAGWSWESAMDVQILQKILPKLHGSKRKIGTLLVALATYCEKGDEAAAVSALADEGKAEAYPVSGDKVFSAPRFAESHCKLRQMIESVRRDQFVSFIQ